VYFASFLSGGFITAIVVNSPERKLAKCTYVHCIAYLYTGVFLADIGSFYVFSFVTVQIPKLEQPLGCITLWYLKKLCTLFLYTIHMSLMFSRQKQDFQNLF
jgi:hypothetical protein